MRAADTARDRIYGTLKDERGVSLVLLALSIFVLFGFGALAIDIGHLYNVKNQLQAAADSAALAGAAMLNEVDVSDTIQTPTRNACYDMAMKNFADTGPDGNPIPVFLKPSNGNSPADDEVCVGNYSYDTRTFSPGVAPVNAVLVTAKRAGAPNQPRVSNWFAGIFKLLGNNFDLTSISASAIAARGTWFDAGSGRGPVLPIAVNEYWTGGTPSPVYGAPQGYPNSFTRQVNVDGSTSTMALNTFAILGGAAEDNVPSSMGGMAASNVNGYLNLDWRVNNHYGTDDSSTPANPDGSWYHVEDSGNGCLNTCTGLDPELVPNGALTDLGSSSPSEGDSTGSAAKGVHREYLHTGYPKTPPVPADERWRGELGISYPASLKGDPPTDFLYPETQDCPFSTVSYFPGSGAEPPISWGNAEHDSMPWHERFPEGSKLVAFVYDGSFEMSLSTSATNVVTIVGAVIIEIDGYDSGNPLGVGLQPVSPGDRVAAAANPDFEPDYSFNKADGVDGLTKSGNTAYGHVVPHGVPDAIDPFMLQYKDGLADPSDPNSFDPCVFFGKYDTLVENAGSVGLVRLVDDSNFTKYGLKD